MLVSPKTIGRPEDRLMSWSVAFWNTSSLVTPCSAQCCTLPSGSSSRSQIIESYKAWADPPALWYYSTTGVRASSRAEAQAQCVGELVEKSRPLARSGFLVHWHDMDPPVASFGHV